MPDMSINIGGKWNPEGVVSAVTSAYATSGANVNINFTGDLDVIKTKEDQPVTTNQEVPENAEYRQAEGDESCATCVHFKDGACDVWQAAVEASMTCNSHEARHTAEDHDEYTLSQGDIGELFLAGDDADEDDGLVWKTVLRTGTWQFRPGPGQQPINKPLKVVLSDAQEGEIALRDVLASFEDGAVEHVTVPLSHADKVDENTGYVRKMKILEGADGVHRLVAGIEFTDPSIREKVLNRSIANTSVGLVFDYLRKEDGKRYAVAMAHTALTNRPWINGMEPFGSAIAASEESSPTIYGLELQEEADEDVTASDAGEGTEVHASEESVSVDPPPGEPAPPDLPALSPLQEAQRKRELQFSDKPVKEDLVSDFAALVEGLELSEEQKSVLLQHAPTKAERDELERLRKESRDRKVTDRVEELKEMGFSAYPGFLKTVREILLSDDGGAALNLSEEKDGQTVESQLTASQIVDKLVDAFPVKDGKVDFAEQASGLVADDKPPVDAEGENKTAEERVAEARKFLGLE